MVRARAQIPGPSSQASASWLLLLLFLRDPILECNDFLLEDSAMRDLGASLLSLNP